MTQVDTDTRDVTLSQGEPPITLTPRAVEMGKKRIVEAQADTPELILGLRIGVKGGGCSGYYYVYDVATKQRKRDMVFDFGGLRVFIDDRSAELLKGGVLDWETRLLGYGFKWQNPNATGDCGCGASFTTD
ncbi:MAG: iron-sulfur cluster assembly accessory protein [Myxococcales bacterium]|nr:iron-sulfur cluster assembly accessory protein [Myxococcales bacterium]